MNLIFYKTKSQFNELNKTLLNAFNITGNLNNDCDVINPIINISLEHNIFDYNYVYIEAFHRYYFVKSMIVVNKMIQVQLHCDVLMSFKTDILTSTATIIRTNQGDNYISDNMILQKSKVKRQCQKIGNSFTKSEKYVLQLGG